MRQLFILLILYFSMLDINSQEVIHVGWGGSNINFEDTTESKYIKIDSTNTWFIAEPMKKILNIPMDHPYLGKQAILTDTSLHYKSNLRSWFQFKLDLGEECDGYYVSFSHKYDFEQNVDGGYIEASLNNGKTWNNILLDTIILENLTDPFNLYSIEDSIKTSNYQPGFTGTKFEIEKVAFGLNRDIRYINDTLLIRFVIVSDSIDSDNEGWMLDNIVFGGWSEDGIVDNLAKQKLQVFPNPTNGIINIFSENLRIERIDVINIQGLTIQTEYNTNIINLRTLVPGIYILVINGNIRSKIVFK